MDLNPRRALTCRGCAQDFPRNPRQPKRQYCTWECFKSSRHVSLICAVCETPFDSYLSEARKREARGHVACCSRACRNVRTSLVLGGDGTWAVGGRYGKPNQRPGWTKLRRAYLKAVRGQCEGCGGCAAEVHHLQPLARGGELLEWSNLVAVCKGCHENMHAQLRAGAFDGCFEENNA